MNICFQSPRHYQVHTSNNTIRVHLGRVHLGAKINVNCNIVKDSQKDLKM